MIRAPKVFLPPWTAALHRFFFFYSLTWGVAGTGLGFFPVASSGVTLPMASRDAMWRRCNRPRVRPPPPAADLVEIVVVTVTDATEIPWVLCMELFHIFLAGIFRILAQNLPLWSLRPSLTVGMTKIPKILDFFSLFFWLESSESLRRTQLQNQNACVLHCLVKKFGCCLQC